MTPITIVRDGFLKSKSQPQGAHITEREIEVIRLVAERKANKEIAWLPMCDPHRCAILLAMV
jgi:DNA-binding CsgD family transcriptional regulator